MAHDSNRRATAPDMTVDEMIDRGFDEMVEELGDAGRKLQEMISVQLVALERTGEDDDRGDLASDMAELAAALGIIERTRDELRTRHEKADRIRDMFERMTAEGAS
jgi:hypothetical protein